jgi:hypothetical protein
VEVEAPIELDKVYIFIFEERDWCWSTKWWLKSIHEW